MTDRDRQAEAAEKSDLRRSLGADLETLDEELGELHQGLDGLKRLVHVADRDDMPRGDQLAFLIGLVNHRVDTLQDLAQTLRVRLAP